MIRSALSITVRDAREADLPAVLAIYNDVIATSTAIYKEQPSTVAERTEWWRSRVAAGYASEQLGFERVAHFRGVAFKFGRWLDLVFLQRTLEKTSDSSGE